MYQVPISPQGRVGPHAHVRKHGSLPDVLLSAHLCKWLPRAGGRAINERRKTNEDRSQNKEGREKREIKKTRKQENRTTRKQLLRDQQKLTTVDDREPLNKTKQRKKKGWRGGAIHMYLYEGASNQTLPSRLVAHMPHRTAKLCGAVRALCDYAIVCVVCLFGWLFAITPTGSTRRAAASILLSHRALLHFTSPHLTSTSAAA